MRRLPTIVVALTLSCAAVAQPAPVASDGPLFDAVTGYRLTHYRGVVGPAPEGVALIDTAQAKALWRRGAIFIDVNPAPGGIRDLRSGRWVLAELHDSIPGAFWFPDSGRGTLPDDVERWFLSGVRRLAARHPRQALVVFCQADCWMSWNASLRLHRAGLRRIRWFSDGLDGWKELRFETTRALPTPIG